MSLTKPQPKAGEPCPQCGGEFKAMRVPTPEEFAAFMNKETTHNLPPGSDTATPEQIAEFGVLHVCQTCGYRTRILPTPADQAPAEKATAGKGKRGTSTGTNGD